MHNHRPLDPPFALVTAASSRLAFELARNCAKHGFDLLVAAEDAAVEDLGALLRRHGTAVQAVQVDPAEPGGVQRLLGLLAGRPVDALVAHAGHGLDRVLAGACPRRGPADPGPGPFVKAHLKGTVELIQAVARRMRACDAGRVLLLGPTGQEPTPGPLLDLCRGTRQFIDGFADALRQEFEDSGLTVTCCMPSCRTPPAPESPMSRTEPPAAWARAAFEAMMHGEPEVLLPDAWQDAMAAVPHWRAAAGTVPAAAVR
jgi:short-subunit dehydrogenase